MPTVNDGRDIHIDDVTVLQFVAVGDPMADDIINTGATALGIILISQRCRFMAMIEGPLMDELINRQSRDSSLHMRP